MRKLKDSCPNFLDKCDLRFKSLHNTLMPSFTSFTPKGVGIHVKHAEVISFDDDMKLWGSGVMGLENLSSLQNAGGGFHSREGFLLERRTGT